MATKAQTRSKSKNSGAPSAKAHDAKLLKQAKREDAEGMPAAPLSEHQRLAITAEELTKALEKQRIERLAEEQRYEAKRQREKALADTLVPITLSDFCSLIAHDVKPESFAATALTELAKQLDVVSELAERTEFCNYEAFAFTQNIRERMRLAGQVSAWLANGAKGDTLPTVEP